MSVFFLVFQKLAVGVVRGKVVQALMAFWAELAP